MHPRKIRMPNNVSFYIRTQEKQKINFKVEMKEITQQIINETETIYRDNL